VWGARRMNGSTRFRRRQSSFRDSGYMKETVYY